jgi:anti-sigma factor RsiW
MKRCGRAWYTWRRLAEQEKERRERMTCLHENRNGAELLLDYAAGSLTPELVAEIDQHAASCAACRNLLDAQKQVWSDLDAMPVPEISANFDERLYARIAQEQNRSLVQRWFRRWFTEVPVWKPVLAGGLACAVLAIGLAVKTPRVSDTTKQASIDNDMDQVEQVLEDLDMLTPLTASDRM